MDFALSPAQRDLADAARRYLARQYPPARIAALAGGPGGSEAGSWPELTRQGWLDDDLGLVELCLLAQESGYALHPTPWWSTVALAAPVYRAAGDKGADGPATAALRAGPGPTARGAGLDWTLTGTARRVPDAQPAVEIVVRADTGAGPALFAVATDGPGVALTALAGIDPLRPLSDVDLTAAGARLLVPPGTAAAVLAGGYRQAAVLLAAEAVGVAARTLDLAVAYAGQRSQFGRPIGSYQAVAHPLADGYAQTELARSLVYRAAWLAGTANLAGTADGGDPGGGAELARAVAAALIAARQAALGCAETAIQTAGGMGVTWEYPLHHWYRRALWCQAYDGLGGDPYATIADSLLGPADTVEAPSPRPGGAP